MLKEGLVLKNYEQQACSTYTIKDFLPVNIKSLYSYTVNKLGVVKNKHGKVMRAVKHARTGNRLAIHLFGKNRKHKYVTLQKIMSKTFLTKPVNHDRLLFLDGNKDNVISDNMCYGTDKDYFVDRYSRISLPDNLIRFKNKLDELYSYIFNSDDFVPLRYDSPKFIKTECDGRYLISNTGLVYSLKSAQFLSIYENSKGFLITTLIVKNDDIKVRIAKAVLGSFTFDFSGVTLYRDKNKLNCNLNNLYKKETK